MFTFKFYSSRTYRYAAYRQFTWLVHNWLGKGVRRAILACVISVIRAAYPSPDGTYTGYKDRESCSEMDFAWVWDCVKD